MINNDKQYKKMKRTILRRAFAQALFATIGLTLSAADVWLWPIEGQRAGQGILYRPQDNIEKELNFGGLFIAAPEGTNVLCPADAVVTSCDYTYYTSLTNSVGGAPTTSPTTNSSPSRKTISAARDGTSAISRSLSASR